MTSTKHPIVLKYIDEHPLYKEIYNDELLCDFSERWSKKSHAWPELYCAIANGTWINLETFEVGFQFVNHNVKGQPKSDCISRLRDTKNIGTVFEITFFGSLILEFGESNIKAYPKFPNGQRAEVLIELENYNIFFEASVLYFSKEDIKSFKKAKNNDGASVGWLSGTGEGRVITKFEEKIQRYHDESPNIFLLSQYSCLPFEKHGIEAIESYLSKYGKNEPACHFSGVFYFDRFHFLKWIRNIDCRAEIQIQDEHVNQLTNAFNRMLPQN